MRGEGKSEEVAFRSGCKATSLRIAAEGNRKFIARLCQEGYVLQGSLSTGAGVASALFLSWLRSHKYARVFRQHFYNTARASCSLLAKRLRAVGQLNGCGCCSIRRVIPK